jgi:hypothetical protein
MTATSKTLLRALAEIAFIIFLFYTNLLMGEFTRARSMPHSLSMLSALSDIFTPANAVIGLIGAIIGYFCIESFRKLL